MTTATRVFARRDRLVGSAGAVEVGFTGPGIDVGDHAPGPVRRAGLVAIADETGARPVVMHQVHGAHVHLVGDGDRTTDRPRADALVTRRAGVALLARAADCVPLLLADSDTGLVAAVHAGREGLVRGVVTEAVGRMRALGAGPLTAWVGPHICGDCYEVPAGMAGAVAAVVPEAAARTAWGTPAVDLAAGVLAQLADAGVGQVRRLDECTRESEAWPSFRRQGATAGRFAAVVWRS